MRRSGKSSADDEDRLFEQAMTGVDRLDEHPDRIEKGRAVPRRRRAESGRVPTRKKLPAFDVEHCGERHQGLARGADSRELRRLRQGRIPVDLRLDLHGYTEEEAREAVLAALERARRAGKRCLLVVHGRGRRSAAGPVLKKALPGWLTDAPQSRRVLAFTSAGPGSGGSGATLVLLRKR